MGEVGKSYKRVDAFEKVTGRAKYTDDLCPKDALVAKVVHSTIANGKVLSVDIEEALKIEGVVKIITCFDVPKNYFPTAGHPWSLDKNHQDVADRLLLTDRVLYYGDDVAVVVAATELAAKQAASLVKVSYEEYDFVLDPIEAMKDGAPLLHKEYPNNILNHTSGHKGNYEEAKKEEGLLCVDKWYKTPTVQHCHIENHICYSYMEKGRIVVVSSTQIPHIVRRIVGQALNCDWGQIRIIKPYIGGGFGNKQDALYEPLCAYLTTQLGGRTVKIDLTREETFVSNRVRHALTFHLVTYFRKDGTFVARKLESFSKQGAYTSHGHSIAAKGTNGFAQLYTCDAYEFDAYTVFTNTSVAGAMRGYGMPQISFAMEAHMDDIAKVLGMNPVELRRKNLMPLGYYDDFSHNKNYYPSHEECMQKAMKYIGWEEKYKKYQNQTGPVRRGIGMALFWYNTSVYPISLEISSCRMVMNQDGSIQMQVGETEIGQGADTAFSQMAADAVGIKFENVHIISTQDTDETPFGLGSYASRQTYVAGKAIWDCGRKLRDKMLERASGFLNREKESLDIEDGVIIYKPAQQTLMTVGELAMKCFYDTEHAEHLTAEASHQSKSNAYSFGCCFAEVEVDIPLCKVKLIDMINVHDCGTLINRQLAEAQVHGGMSMAIGYGMNEQLLFDEKTGRPLNGNLLDYKLSTTLDHPHLEAQFVENPEPTHPFGTKALGEPPACPGGPAIRNAILCATGVAVDELPANSTRLYEAFQKAGLFEELKEYV